MGEGAIGRKGDGGGALAHLRFSALGKFLTHQYANKPKTNIENETWRPSDGVSRGKWELRADQH